MIRVERAAEPEDFDALVRRPGEARRARGADGRASDLWPHAMPHLRRAFEDRCGYTAMWLSSPGTVDHFVSRAEDPSLTYEWTNLRYAAAWVNGSSATLAASQRAGKAERNA